MFLPQKSLNGRQLVTAFFRRGVERKWNSLAEEKARAGTERTLADYRAPLSQVTSFKYLG